MPNINYAIEVQSGTSLTDTSKGISAGVFYFISGLFSRLGVSPSGDTSQASWYENLIKSMSSVSKRVDVESGGRYATLSGFSFDIDNSIKFSVWLEAQGISLYKKIVKVYYVKDGVFYLDWTGQVDRISISHSAVKIQCIDIFKSIHRDCPPILFSKIANPLIQNSIIGKPVPICLGLVNNAKLFNTEVNTNKTVLYIDPATSDQASVCACSAYTTSLTATSVTLKTGSKVFSTDDLKDQWLVTILGSAKEGIRIINNTASSGGLTILSLEKGFSKNTNVTLWSSGNLTYIDPPATYFEINKFYTIGTLSSKEIFSITNSTYLKGAKDLRTFDDALSSFVQLDHIMFLSDTVNISSSGKPGIKIMSSMLDIEGSYRALFFIKPRAIKLKNLQNIASNTFPSVGSDCPNLYNGDQSTGYSLGITSPGYISSVEFNILFQSQVQFDSFEDLTLVFDAVKTQTGGSVSISSDTYRAVALKDIYGRRHYVAFANGGDAFTPATISDQVSGPGVSINSFYIPPTYYTGIAGDNSRYMVAKNSGLSLKRALQDLKTVNVFPTIELTLSFTNNNGTSESVSLREVGIVGEKGINVKTSDIYTSLKGEIFNNTWSSRKVASDPVLNPSEMIEYIIRAYDVGYSDTNYATLTGSYLDTASFDQITNTDRATWKIGTQLVDQTNSFDIIQQILQDTMLAIVPNKQGQRKLIAWADNTTPVHSFDFYGTIIRGSIGDVQDISFDKIFNEFSLSYDKNPANGSYNKNIAILYTDQAVFPAAGTFESDDTTSIPFTSYAPNGGSPSYVHFVCNTSLYGIKAGDYITFSGGYLGFSFPKTIVVFLDSTGFWVVDPIGSTLVYPNSYSTGTLLRYNSAVLLWKTYVTGIETYATATTLWNSCHSAFLLTGKKNRYEAKLPFFVDEKPWGGTTDSDTAIKFTQKLVPWLTKRKRKVSFTPDAEYSASTAELLQPCNFSDPIITNGASIQGWITSVALNPQTDKQDLEIIYLL